jgi:rubredoxin
MKMAQQKQFYPIEIGITISEYYGYSENMGEVSCPNCEGEIWVSIPENGDVINCHDCKKSFEYEEN